MSMEHYLQELQELRALVAQQVRDIDHLKRTGSTATWLDRCAWVAMQGLLGGLGEDRKQHLWEARNIAETAYRVADALLAEKRRREGVAS